MLKMNTINEEENDNYNNTTNLNNKDYSDIKTTKLLSTTKEPYYSPNGIDEDLYNFIEEIHKQNYKVKNKFTPKIDLRKENKSLDINDKSKKAKLGLSDNQTVDAENKSKAQKGLLLLLNKLSGGEFVPEINTYFLKKKEEIRIQKSKDLEEKANEEEKTKILEKRKMNRQKNMTSIFKNETFNNIFKEENEDIGGLDSIVNKYNDNSTNNLEKKNKLMKQQAYNINKGKNFDEDKEFNIYDNLMMFFTKKEAQEISDIRKNEDDYNYKFVRKEGFRKTKKK